MTEFVRCLAQNVQTTRISQIRGLAMMQVARCEKVVRMDDNRAAIANMLMPITECLRFWYQVYRVEDAFEPGNNDVGTDVFDEHTRLGLLSDRVSGESIRTVRVIPSSDLDRGSIK
jgi:hypothetical protein